MENNELRHYGVLGMKWGRRRYQNRDGTLTNAGKKRYERELAKVKQEQKVLKNKQRTQAKIDKLESMQREVADTKARMKAPKKEDAGTDTSKRKVSVRAKRPKHMTNEELRDYIDRLKLEKDYDDIVNKTHSVTVSKGKSFVENVLTKAGENITTQVAVYGLGTAVNKIAGSEIVNPKKGQKDK